MGFIGFLRTSGLVIFSLVCAILLVLLGMTLTVGFSLSYENVQKELPGILKQVYFTPDNQEAISENILQMQFYCNQTGVQSVSLPLNHSDFQDLAIPCSEIYLGTNSVVDYGVSELVKQVYYKEYSCSGVRDCFDKSPTYLVSEGFHSELLRYSLILLILVLLCFVFIFLLSRKKSNACFVSGGILLVVSLILLFLGNVVNSFMLMLPSTPGISASSIANIFFSSSTSIFLVFAFFGLASIIAGIILKVLAAEKVVEDDEEAD